VLTNNRVGHVNNIHCQITHTGREKWLQKCAEFIPVVKLRSVQVSPSAVNILVSKICLKSHDSSVSTVHTVCYT